MRTALFPLGHVVATPGAVELLTREEIVRLLSRHMSGDWGYLCPEDSIANDSALENGGRLFSSYLDEDETKFWVITEADRSATTILLPEEY